MSVLLPTPVCLMNQLKHINEHISNSHTETCFPMFFCLNLTYLRCLLCDSNAVHLFYVLCSFTNSWVHSSLQGNYPAVLPEFPILVQKCQLPQLLCLQDFQPTLVSTYICYTRDSVHEQWLCMRLLPLGCWSQELPVSPRPYFVRASHRQWASVRSVVLFSFVWIC